MSYVLQSDWSKLFCLYSFFQDEVTIEIITNGLNCRNNAQRLAFTAEFISRESGARIKMGNIPLHRMKICKIIILFLKKCCNLIGREIFLLYTFSKRLFFRWQCESDERSIRKP